MAGKSKLSERPFYLCERKPANFRETCRNRNQIKKATIDSNLFFFQFNLPLKLSGRTFYWPKKFSNEQNIFIGKFRLVKRLALEMKSMIYSNSLNLNATHNHVILNRGLAFTFRKINLKMNVIYGGLWEEN